ncbi:ATP-binding protein [Ensifer sp. LC163]|uniref:ATP-binding protein n=1 Tax=Ensifer sp. LC163 TaxID=1120652 RepID=UPI000812F204|nr:AAA family ATPase [Ensifer sp. LC163]OCP36546.1 sugar translocase [Ensifer sp. LC163]
MRLRELDLVRYGKFTERRLDFGPATAGRPDLHIVYGPNEAGKSTLFSGFLDLLFGIEHYSSYGFLHPYQTMRVGGTIEAAGRTHQAFRIKRKTNTLVGADDQPLPDNLFSASLGSIDRATYRMMFSLDDDSIEQGGEAILKSEGELGSLLFSASSGLPDSAAILSTLRAEADAFYRPQARKHQLSELKAELDALKVERNGLDVNAREYASLRKTLFAARERHDAAMARRVELRVERDRLKAQIDALPLFRRLCGLRADLARTPTLPLAPAEWATELPALRRRDVEIATKLRQLDDETRRRQEELEDLPRDEAALILMERLNALQEVALDARYVTAARDMPARIEELSRTKTEIAACLIRLGEPGDRDPASLLLPTATNARLQELSRQHSALQERAASARQEADGAKRAEQEAASELARLKAEGGPCVDSGALAERLRRLRQDDCGLRLRAARQSLERLDAELACKLEALKPYSGSADDLLGLPVPAAGTIETWRRDFATQDEKRLRLADRVASETEQLAGEEARLAALVASGGAIDDRASAELRQHRQHAWEQHRARLDTTTAALFEDALNRDDDAAALRLAEAAKVADMRSLALSIAERRARLDALRKQRLSLAEESSPLAKAVTTAAAVCGLPNVTQLPELEAWLAARLVALDIREQQRSTRLDLARAQADENDARDVLKESLAEIGVIERLPKRLDDLLAFAENAVAQAQAAFSAGKAAREAVRRAGDMLEQRQSTLAQAEDALSSWQEQWDDPLSATWLADRQERPLPDRVAPMLAVLQDLDKLVQRKADLDHRVAGMRKDQVAFETAVADLAGMPGIEDTLATFAAMRARVADAEKQEDRRAALLAELLRVEEEKRTIAAEQDLHTARKRLVLDFFNCETLDEAGLRLDAAREQERLRQRIAESEADLASRLGVAGSEDAEALLATLDDETVRLELARVEALLEESDRDVSELHADVRTKEAALANIAGDDTVAALDQRRRTLLLEIEAKALGYLKLKAGVIAAEQALRLFRERHRSAMMRRASETFSRISGGEYSSLSAQADKGQEFLIANAAAGGSKLARDLSKGTRFQLYLSLRIAGYHEVAAARETLPFIADDIMETFDDGRAGRAFELMADMARVGQVIYLTHHGHLCDIARTACPEVTIHRL